MEEPYLTQLKQQRLTIEALLQAERAISKPKAGAGFRIVVQFYGRLLEDALKTVNALIQHLERNTEGNQAVPVSQAPQDSQRPQDQ